MEGFGNSALIAAAPRVVLQAAAVPDALAIDAVFPGAGFPSDVFPGDAFADDGLPYDDDLGAVYPASLPEDPFPDALFADRPFDEELMFDDGVPASAATTWPAAAGAPPTTSGWFLPAADLTADNAGLIDQVRAYENVKCWAAGQQARLSVTFDARLRQESTDRPPLAAEDLGKDRGKDSGLDAADRSRWPAASRQTADNGCSARQKPWCRCPTPRQRWTSGS